MSDYRKLISSYVVSDAETGEAISVRERIINIPQSISFPQYWSKVFYVVKESMTDSEIGKFFKLTEYLDFDTNRLVDQHVGRSPKPLNQIDISKIINRTPRLTNTFMTKMKSINAIIKIDGDYYMNPRFASRSKGIDTDIIIKMIKIDPLIKKAMSRTQWYRLKYYIIGEAYMKQI